MAQRDKANGQQNKRLYEQDAEPRSLLPNFNLPGTHRLLEDVRSLMKQASRVNPYKPEEYWYPLSIATYDAEEVTAALDSLCSFRTTMWAKTNEFEQAFCRALGYREGVMVNSGSSADLLISFSLLSNDEWGLQRGDEILMPSITWPTQVWSVMMAGFVPVFVDADPYTLNMDIEDLKVRITPRTRAIFVVHLMGNPCRMSEILEISSQHDLIVVEDCCEALGAEVKGRPVGSFGVASSFSFFFSHHITTMEGGMIVTQEREPSDLFRLLRAHGWSRNLKYLDVPATAGLDPRYTFLNWGFNVRPTELQAAWGLVQLARLETFERYRAENAAFLLDVLRPYRGVVDCLSVEKDAKCSWFAFPIMVSDDAPFRREDLARYLEENGVETRPILAGNLAMHPVKEVFPELKALRLPGADAIHERGLYLGLYPVECRAKLERLSDLLVSFLDGHTRA